MKLFTGRRALGALVFLTLVVGAGNLLASYLQVQASDRAQRSEQRRFEKVQEEDKQRTAAAQLKASIPVCMALLRLSRVHGSHGNSGATFGIHLESALEGVYRTSGCPKVLALTRHGG